MENDSNDIPMINATLLSIIIIVLAIIVFLKIFESIAYNLINIKGLSDDNSHQEHVEHYDYEIQNVSLTECGTQCTEALNCLGFGYKPIEKKCYLSKTAIVGEPMESIYSDQYTKLDRRCNKINRINDNRRIDGNTMTANSVYVCSDGENNVATEFQYANLGATSLASVPSTIFDRADSDNTIPINVKYEVHNIVWPKNKTDQTSDRISYLDDKKQNPGSQLDANQTHGFVESEKEFLGQYLLGHQCVVGVPFFDCLKYCENDSKCAGTEWNKSIIKRSDTNANGQAFDYLYENVCCPKTVIKKIIPRRKEFDRGRFYVKRTLQDMMQRDKVVFTKADFKDTIPINKRFDLKITEFDNAKLNDAAQQNITTVQDIEDPIV
jgi:hypothetical protein